jgi:hypothetical protein
MGQGNLTKISNISIERKLKNATNVRTWGFRAKRNDFVVVTSDQVTVVFDLTKMVWSTWDSFDYPIWRAHVGMQRYDTVYAGDFVNGTLWQLQEGPSGEDSPMVRQVSGFVPTISNEEPCFSVNVRVNTGNSASLLTEPYLELRWSDDYGLTWSEYVQAGLGVQGAYLTDVTYRSLGQMDRPGREFELKYTDITDFRLDYGSLNEV